MSNKVLVEETLEAVLQFINSTINQFTNAGANMASVSPSKGRSPSKSSSKYQRDSRVTLVSKKLLTKSATKWGEMLELFGELLELCSSCSLTDTLILSLTRAALGSFFVDPALVPSTSNELQLNASRVLILVFSQYKSHQTVILEELLNSVPRVQTSKKWRSEYKVDPEAGGATISMFSALILQLITSIFNPSTVIQSVTGGASKAALNGPKDVKSEAGEGGDVSGGGASETGRGSGSKRMSDLTPREVNTNLKSCYDSALRLSWGFVESFLKKCNSSNQENEFRQFLEYFVQDLLSTLHKPNFASSQLMLQVFIRLLLLNIRPKAKNTTQSMKLSSLELVGQICSRLSLIFSSLEDTKNEIDESIKSMSTELDQDDNHRAATTATPKKGRKSRPKGQDKNDSNAKEKAKDGSGGISPLNRYWIHLFRYCDEEKLDNERNMLAATYLKEIENEVRSMTKREAHQRRASRESRDEDSEESDDGGEGSKGENQAKIEEMIEKRTKDFVKIFQTYSSRMEDEAEYQVIDSKTAEWIVRYVDCEIARTCKVLYEASLCHVIAALSNAQNIQMRARAMKCLSAILNQAPQHYASILLQRDDLQTAMRAALLDASSSVRESTIDLIGKFVLNSKDHSLIDKYYDVISARIIDSGKCVCSQCKTRAE